MHQSYLSASVIGAVVLPALATAAGIAEVADCQRMMARAGAQFAERVIKSTLKCTNEIVACQVQCENNVFGQPCDPDDPGSNQAFGACMSQAEAECDEQDLKIQEWEVIKEQRIRSRCIQLTNDQLCGASTPGLNFAALAAGCEEIIPGWQCNLDGIIDCVGGPLQLQLAQQIAGLFEPRAGEALAATGVAMSFPGLPITRKVADDVAAGKVDIYSFPGQVGDEVTVRLRTRDDNADGTSNLQAQIFLLDVDVTTPVPDTSVKPVPCNVENVCGGECQTFTRTLPFTGTFFLAVKAIAQNGCSGGGYRLVVTTPRGTTPALLFDDIDPIGF
jgi:hypothetical protein